MVCAAPSIKEVEMLSPKTASPSGLADTLADAKIRLDTKVHKAKADFEEVRAGVIERGTAQVNNIVALRAELATEQAQLESVLERAKL
jgi:hypothetical protein